MKLSDLLVPSTRYSKFRCDTYKKFSANPGILYPVWFNLLNPGESATVDLRSVIRTWPVESPLMGSMKVRFVTCAFNIKNYAMALEGYNRNFDWRSTTLPNIRYHFAYNSVYGNTPTNAETYGGYVNFAYNVCVHDCSLHDYLGYPSGWLPTMTTTSSEVSSYVEATYKSFLPFLCYYDFYRNYLVNPQEKEFPMFIARNEKVSMVNPADETAVDVIRPTTWVKMLPISILDDLIAKTHKAYDGTYNGYMQEVMADSDFFNWFKVKFYRPDIDVTLGGIGNICSVPHGGLVSTMFDSDINTQWLSIENYEKLDSVRINTQTNNGSTYSSFGDIVKASSLWDFITKSVNSDGTYGDFIGNQFGVPVKGDMNIPQIVHVYDSLLTFDDITSQADTASSDGAVVGQQFGVGRSYGQSNHFKVVNKDGNYVMLMTFMWVTPTVCYKDGLNHLHNINSFADLYQPSFDNYSMQPRLQEQVNGRPIAVQETSDPNVYKFLDASVTPFSTPVVGSTRETFSNVYDVPGDVVLGYQPAWSDYKTDVDVVHGLFRHELDFYTIIRSVPFVNDTLNGVASSYLYYPLGQVYARENESQQWSLPFAIEKEDCMQVQLRVGCTVTRAMSKNVNPNIK